MQQFHDLGICCSYDELLRFKASAAVATSNKTQLTGIQSSDMGLVKPLQITLMPYHLTQWTKVNSCFDPNDDTGMSKHWKKVRKVLQSKDNSFNNGLAKNQILTTISNKIIKADLIS